MMKEFFALCGFFALLIGGLSQAEGPAQPTVCVAAPDVLQLSASKISFVPVTVKNT